MYARGMLSEVAHVPGMNPSLRSGDPLRPVCYKRERSRSMDVAMGAKGSDETEVATQLEILA